MKETKLIKVDDVTIEYHVEGEGNAIVLLPSRGRDQADFDGITSQIASQGFKVIRPEYRGMGRSKGPMEGVDLHDLAAEVSTVLEEEKVSKAFIVGHAFGNWIARIVALNRPDLVQGICVLAAAAKGKFDPEINDSLSKSSDLTIPSEIRVDHIRRVFFTEEGNAAEWLTGWYPEATDMQKKASVLTPQEEWWPAGGVVPIFEIRAELDPLAPKERAQEMREMFGDRVTTVEIPNASHALIPEQPEAVVAALVTYAKLLFKTN